MIRLPVITELVVTATDSLNFIFMLICDDLQFIKIPNNSIMRGDQHKQNLMMLDDDLKIVG